MRYLLILFLFLTVTGCRKSIPNPDSELETFPVNFQVDGFNQVLRPILSTNSNYHDDYSTEEIVNLLFRVYDKNDNLVKHEFQKASQVDFGKYSVSLPRGSFKFAAIAYSNSMNVTATYNDISSHGMGIPLKQFFPYSVTSYEHFDVRVSDLIQFEVGDQQLDEVIHLERLWGRLTLRILDEIPTESGKLFFKIDNAISDIRYPAFHHTPNRQTHELGELYDLETYSNKAGQEFSMKVLVPFSEVNSTLTIYCYDKNDDLMVTKTVSNVKIERNHVTLVEGNLFDSLSSSESGFSITTSEHLSPDTIKVSF